MILFLTSSPTGDLDGKYKCEGFDTRNGFAEQVKKYWKENANVLMITAFPDNKYANQEMGSHFQGAIAKTGLSFCNFDLWDADILKDKLLYSRAQLHSYDVIILGGGHVPTQQKFFRQLNLRENIKGFEGIVIGISAGTMNCADVVYAQPEEPGEATDPNYQRFIEGLGITDINILPHYQIVKDEKVDGLRVMEDISVPDSVGREFIAIPDGSYVVVENEYSSLSDGDHIVSSTVHLYGDALLLKDGKMMPYAPPQS